MSGSSTITGGTLEIDSGLDLNGDGDFIDPGEHPPVTVPVPTSPAPNTTIDGHVHFDATTDSFRYVFNEQVLNADGSLTVHVAHELLRGPTAVGDVFIGEARCAVTLTALAAPANISPPTITGVLTQGQTLTAGQGAWTNGPDAFAYQWLGCDGAANNCSAIAGATSQSYVLTATDVGHELLVAETASNAAGPGPPARSLATGVVGAPPPANQSPLAPLAGGQLPPPAVAPATGPGVRPTAGQIRASLLSDLAPKGTAASIGKIRRAGGYSMVFTALTAGSARVDWLFARTRAQGSTTQPKTVHVAGGRLDFSSAGTRMLKLKLTAAGRRLLRNAGRLKLTAVGHFTAAGATAVGARKTFTLK